MARDFAKQFYASKAWRDLAFMLKVDRGGKCNRCNKIIIDSSNLIGHHTIELTEDNINNPTISLNPTLIEIICTSCHNQEHRRFGSKRNVYIVYGSPLSGKNYYVNQVSRYGDLIIDIDEIWRSVSGQDKYIKPNNLRFNIFALRDNLFDQIKTRYGQWYDCYIIGGYPNQIERNDIARRLGAELVYIESTKEECLERAKERPREWIEYIEKWWNEYTPHTQ